jgi:hypothetical protein
VAAAGLIVRATPRAGALLRPSIALLALAAAGCADRNVVTHSYATSAEARQAGALDRGWIPLPLPAGAYEIREAHDESSDRRWGLFNFREEDTAALRRLLGPEVSLAGARCEPPGRIEWWPVQLRGELDHDRLAATGLRAYRSAEADLLIAINWAQRRGYYWRDQSLVPHP